MKSPDQNLDRLLESAARAPRLLPRRAPFAVESRLLAHWRRLPLEKADLAQMLLPVLRRAALCACLLMLASIALSYRTILNGDDDIVTIANSAMDSALLP